MCCSAAGGAYKFPKPNLAVRRAQDEVLRRLREWDEQILPEAERKAYAAKLAEEEANRSSVAVVFPVHD